MMVSDAELRSVERRAYLTARDDGLWDLLVASVLLMWAIAPLLSTRMGDFWSAAVFVPLWAALYALVRFVRRRVLAPRIGEVRLGAARQARLLTFRLVMLPTGVFALALGVVAAWRGIPEAWGVTTTVALVALVLFSVAATFLDIPRIYLYGLLLAGAVCSGEWLYQHGYTSDHGYPLAFGAAAAVIAASGLARLTLLLRPHPGAGEQDDD